VQPLRLATLEDIARGLGLKAVVETNLGLLANLHGHGARVLAAHGVLGAEVDGLAGASGVCALGLEGKIGGCLVLCADLEGSGLIPSLDRTPEVLTQLVVDTLDLECDSERIGDFEETAEAHVGEALVIAMEDSTSDCEGLGLVSTSESEREGELSLVTYEADGWVDAEGDALQSWAIHGEGCGESVLAIVVLVFLPHGGPLEKAELALHRESWILVVELSSERFHNVTRQGRLGSLDRHVHAVSEVDVSSDIGRSAAVGLELHLHACIDWDLARHLGAPLVLVLGSLELILHAAAAALGSDLVFVLVELLLVEVNSVLREGLGVKWRYGSFGLAVTSSNVSMTVGFLELPSL